MGFNCLKARATSRRQFTQLTFNKFTLFFTNCCGKLQIIEEHFVLLTRGNPKTMFFKKRFSRLPIVSFINDMIQNAQNKK